MDGISVVVPCYNAAEYLSENLSSVLPKSLESKSSAAVSRNRRSSRLWQEQTRSGASR